MENLSATRSWRELLARRSRVLVFARPMFFWLLGGGLGFSLLAAALRNLDDSDFWLDESGQYWMALGQHHYYAVDTEPKVFSFQYAASHNLDPPGFGLVLRAWIEIFGSQTISLRFLPFLFFLGFLFVVGLIGKQFLEVPIPVGASIALALIVAGPGDQYSTELRAYSAELFAVALSLWAALRWEQRRSASAAWGLFGALLFGLWFTRYSFVFGLVGVVAVYLVAFVRNPTKRKWKELIWLSAGGLSAVALVARFAFFTPGVRPQASPSYVESLFLSSVRKFSDLEPFIEANLFSAVGVPILLLILLGSVLGMGHILSQHTPLKPPASQALNSVMQIWVFSTAYLTAVVAFSAVGLHPWWIESRWSIGLSAVAALSALALYAGLSPENLRAIRALGFRWLPRLRSRANYAVSWLRALALGIVAFPVFLVFSDYRHITYESISSTSGGYDQAAEVYFGTMVEQDDYWFVEKRLWPTFRMTIERDPRYSSPPGRVEMVPFFEGEDVLVEKFLKSEFECPVAGSRTYFLMKPLEELGQSKAFYEEFASNAPCRIVLHNSPDKAFLVTLISGE